jgi:CRISP-associated protein Cas1
MKILLLDGFGINLRVDRAKLIIKHQTDLVNETIVYSPRKINIDHIVVYGRSGEISFDAIRWLMKHYIQVSFLNWDGQLLTSMLPYKNIGSEAKFEQYKAFDNSIQRINLAKKFLEGKFEKQQLILDYLKERYPKVDNDFSKELELYKKANTIQELLLAEGRIASHYWKQFKKIIPKKYEFEGREYKKEAKGTGDKFNCMLNYGYAILEAEILKSINSVGLDRHIGFLHEKQVGKNSLAYDMQEPFRYLIDLAVLDLIENNNIKDSDFIRTENYNLRLRSSGAKKVLESINKHFNHKILYKGDNVNIHYLILLKTRELSNFLKKKSKNIDFTKPKQKLNKKDTEEVRNKILNISYVDWKNKGLSKGTLFYLKKNARLDKPFSMNKNIEEIVSNW